MSVQTAIGESAQLRVWVSLLRAHAALVRRANANLLSRHGLTVNDYEVLLLLSRADGRRMRRVDLAEKVLLTPSGITRLLDGLEAAGYVEKASCASDRRVTYALLTDAGEKKLRVAATDHLADVEAILGERYGDDDLETLASLLARLPMRGETSSCDPAA